MKRSIISKIILLSFLILFSTLLSAQTQNSSKVISGTITAKDFPLADVNIRVEGTQRGTKTDAKGNYQLKARAGDVFLFSYVGFKDLSIIIEDVTTTLNVRMVEKTNALEASIVKARKKQNSISNIKEEDVLNVDLPTPNGILNPYKSGFSTNYLPGHLLTEGQSFRKMLDGKASGVRLVQGQIFIRDKGEAKIDLLIDGVPANFDTTPNINFIEDIFILKRARPIIYVRTIFNEDLIAAKKQKNQPDNTNKNYYEEDAVAFDSELTSEKKTVRTRSTPSGPIKKIRGVISYLDAPLQNVNISVEGSSRGTQTNKRGKYILEARQGEVLVYSHLGFKAVTLIVEDVTETLSFEMVPETNELEEVIVKARNVDGNVVSYTKKVEAKFKTSMGTFDPKKAGYATGYVDGNDINPAARDLFEVIAGKVSGVQVNPVTKEIVIRGGNGSILNNVPPIWEIDGVVTDIVPNIDPIDIKDIRVLKSLASTTRYGSRAVGGVIIISTHSGDFSQKTNTNEINEEYANQNYYSDDAVQVDQDLVSNNSKQQLLAELQTESNPEKLKALAYQFQVLGLKNEAVAAYKKVYTLRPTYAQSYRDLAHAYAENEQFKKSWRMYMGYLNQGFKGSEEGIGELVYDEMEWLYFRRRNQTAIKESFLPKSEDIVEFRNDVRFVFEWNTSEAEFDLEFVSPDRRAYVFEHTLASNQELINEEKSKGYSSKRFFINDIEDGEWLLNLTYKGNKKSAPTYFKLTTYYNWGKINQSQEIKVYKLTDDQQQKLQLLKINKQIMLAYK